MAVGLIGLLELYPSSSVYAKASLWTEPVLVSLLTTAPSIFMFMTPLIGMTGPDPGWNDDTPRVNYSLSHLIDSRALMFAMSAVWVYPASLLWATEYREDWLAGKDHPGGLFHFLCSGSSVFAPVWQGTSVRIIRRISLFVWQFAFAGFLMITDSTKWAWHSAAVNIFAVALVVHLMCLVGSPTPADDIQGGQTRLSAQLAAVFAATTGLVMFLVFNMHTLHACLRRGVGYWYWFAEVLALAGVLWFTPARLFCDQASPSVDFCIVSAVGICLSLAIGVMPLLPEPMRQKILPPRLSDRLRRHH